MRTGRLKLLFLPFLFLLFWAVPLHGGPVQAIEPTTMYQISGGELIELKRLSREQEQELTLLRAKLQALEMSSGERVEKLTELETRCESLRQKISETEQSLQSSEKDLTNARSDLEKSQEYLTELKSEVQEISHKLAVTRRQRDALGALAGVLAGVMIFKG